MHYVKMGATDFLVSDIVHGTYKAGGTDWGPVNDFESIETIRACVDAGVNLIDTASSYGMGRAERLIRWALDEGGRRERVRVMTKWSIWLGRDERPLVSASQQALAEFCAGSQERLGAATLDLVLLHRDDGVTPIEAAVESLARFQQDGKVRHIGVSNYTLPQLERAQRAAPLQNFQIPFSLLDTRVRDDGRLDFCREHEISVGVFGVTAKGLLAPVLKHGDEYPAWDKRRQRNRDEKFAQISALHGRLKPVAERFGMSLAQLASAWVLSHPGVTFAILGSGNPEQARHNAGASGLRLPKDSVEECESLAREILSA